MNHRFDDTPPNILLEFDGVRRIVVLPLFARGGGLYCRLVSIPAGLRTMRLAPQFGAGEFTATGLRVWECGYVFVLGVLLAKAFRSICSLRGEIRLLAEAMRLRQLEALNDYICGVFSLSPKEEPQYLDYTHWVQRFENLEAQPASARTLPFSWGTTPRLTVFLRITPQMDAEHVERCLLSLAGQHLPIGVVGILPAESSITWSPKFHRYGFNTCPMLESFENTIMGMQPKQGFVCILWRPVVLSRHASLAVSWGVASHPTVEILYGDHDQFCAGRRQQPFFKPGWSPDLLCETNYFGDCFFFCASLLKRLGGLQLCPEGLQEWHWALLATDGVVTKNIQRTPYVLFHSFDSAVCEQAAISQASSAEPLRLGGGSQPWVSVIIPTRNQAQMLEGAIDRLLSSTVYPNLEIIIVDNGSDEEACLVLLEQLKQNPMFRILPYPGEFNYSAINNFAARRARGDVLCFMNNDVFVEEPGWLAEMVGLAMRPTTGAVGALLVYGDGSVQHGGVVLGVSSVADHAFCGESLQSNEVKGRLLVRQNPSAVTAAILVVCAYKFHEVGGFDEKYLRISYNDTDFCLKLTAKGYRNVFTPKAKATHLESVSRGKDIAPESMRRLLAEERVMRLRWAKCLLDDPAYHPNLSRRRSFALASHPRAESLRDISYALRVIHSPRWTSFQSAVVYVSSRGNYFFNEIGTLFVAALRDLGLCVRQTDETGFQDGPGVLHLVIAPHEFFLLCPEPGLHDRFPKDRTVMLNTEQRHTPWFSEAQKWLFRESLTLDMDIDMAEFLRGQGYVCEHVPLGYVPGLNIFSGRAPLPLNQATEALAADVRAWSDTENPLETPLVARPLDIAFFGRNTPRRNVFFAENAATFASWNCFLRIEGDSAPLLPGVSTPMNTAITSGISRRTKIALNVHRDEHAYFEWHRNALLGFWQGALVVSEPCSSAWPFEPDVDYVVSPLAGMRDTLDYLLASPQGQRDAERIRANAYTKLTRGCLLSENLKRIFERNGMVLQ